ncbi:unnamed protein product [Paramecium sonneborni]|uniref:Uncharacterized protein n=1 Tax=Paramecium sonneborni TaxID=65129 RepID=A0A8S1QK82_9CILI|nr:unnamed protein product [Paramecium sonneborni]
MGNECKSDTSFEEDYESFAKMSVNPSNSYKIFSETYKMERKEDLFFNMIEKIEPTFNITNEFDIKKRTISCIEQYTEYKRKKVNQKIQKSALKEYSNNTKSNKKHSNKSVTWDASCQQQQ